MEKKLNETHEEVKDEKEAKTPLKERIGNARPVKFVKRHAKGFGAGVAGGVAVVTAAVIAAKVAADRGADGITEVIGDIVDDASSEVVGD